MEVNRIAESIEPITWDFYQQIYLIRRTEESLLSLFSKGLLYGTVHTCIGQEACAVGVINALDRTKDVVWSNHRGHGHFVAYTGNLTGLLGEVMGKSIGVCGGVGGTQHLHETNFYTNGILGGTLPCAVGAGFAEKLKGTGGISAVFFGDGAMAEGAVYESLNMAALWNVPILFVLEHNNYAQTTPTALEHAGQLEQRAAPFGIENTELSADNVLDVYEAAMCAVEKIRETSQPHFLALHTNRFMAHSKGDDSRPADEVARIKTHDPLINLRQILEPLDPQRVADIENSIEQQMEAAIEECTAAEYLAATDYLERASRW